MGLNFNGGKNEMLFLIDRKGEWSFNYENGFLFCVKAGGMVKFEIIKKYDVVIYRPLAIASTSQYGTTLLEFEYD